MHPTVSIITIIYNGEKEVARTISSVLEQNYRDYEYIFVDGKSKDNSLAVIESFRDAFEQKGIAFRVYSEPDKGIYDAMNKGTCLSEGEWLLMLNAGDQFSDADVLRDFFENKSYDADVIYGDTILEENGFFKKRRTDEPDVLPQEMPFCHQSAFVRSRLQKKYMFDMKYKVVADFDMFSRMAKDSIKFQYIRRFVSVFDMSGLSGRNHLVVLEEADRSRVNNGLLPRAPFGLKKHARRFFQYILRIRRKFMKKYGRYYTESRGWFPSADRVI